MTADQAGKTPRFNVGDRVALAIQGPGRPKTGTIAEIPSSAFDAVYRYRVTFDDGTAGTFFGFELELLRDEDEAANF